MKLKKKFAAAALTAALVVPQTVAPAAAQSSDAVPEIQISSEEQSRFWNDLLFPIFGAPIFLSSMLSSIVAPQCSLFDTRGCNG